LFISSETQTFMQQTQPFVVTFVGVTMVAMGAVVTAYANKIITQLKANHTATLEAADAQQKQIAAVADTADKTHTLVNSQMGNVLRVGAISAQALYDKDPKPENLALLNQAQQALDEHMARQKIVDAGDKT
jgi:hypothetical protein